MLKGNKYLLISSLVAAMGGFLFGFDTVVISGAERSIQELFNLNDFWHGFTVAIALIGTIIGTIVAGKPADRFGRKKVLIFISVLYMVSALGSALANQWEMFLFYRFLGGVGVGATSVIGPMYIAEISPAKIRGKMVALFQFNIVFGVLISFLSNYIIAGVVEIDAWRWMLGIETIPAAIFFFSLFLIVPTPRWLVVKGRVEEAKKVLIKLGENEVEEKIRIITIAIENEQKKTHSQLFTKFTIVPVSLAMLIAIFNQFTGINAIMYYTPRIFEIAGLEYTSALGQSVAIGITNMIFTIIAMSIIDKVGRKKLLLIGSVGMSLTLGMVAMAFFNPGFGGTLVLLGLILYIAFFAASQGAVIWVYISEIFPNRIRFKGQTLGSLTHWLFAAMISWLFPAIVSTSAERSGYAFTFFAIMMVIQLVVVYKFFPETKGKSLEQIQSDFGL